MKMLVCPGPGATRPWFSRAAASSGSQGGSNALRRRYIQLELLLVHTMVFQLGRLDRNKCPKSHVQREIPDFDVHLAESKQEFRREVQTSRWRSDRSRSGSINGLISLAVLRICGPG